MKNFILTLFALFFSVVLSANANVKNDKITIETIKVEVPCKIIAYAIEETDTAIINIRNNVYDLKYEIKDNILYIKRTRILEDFECNGENPPIVHIGVNKIPTIKVSKSLTITESKKSKKNNKSNDVASIN